MHWNSRKHGVSGNLGFEILPPPSKTQASSRTALQAVKDLASSEYCFPREKDVAVNPKKKKQGYSSPVKNCAILRNFV
jgi:hypothetical protein